GRQVADAHVALREADPDVVALDSIAFAPGPGQRHRFADVGRDQHADLGQAVRRPSDGELARIVRQVLRVEVAAVHFERKPGRLLLRRQANTDAVAAVGAAAETILHLVVLAVRVEVVGFPPGPRIGVAEARLAARTSRGGGG